ncbi:S-adenosyl-L-methionine-dependent methyltransferase [Parathielavia hyrcaniae]|uniref:catechol O-methyltransferase n=1 Tax=Parathielavia hyrcaniae TaxID=113614 RepID=A0AAN6SZ78_9PEZI|nr:S-adenosyl-L-methionine-dependent methyltransferase [Parathielavia hyrcaniae]
MAAAASEYKPYKPWEVDGKFFGDGREAALLDYVYNHPELDQMRGNPAKVCEAIDAFARSHTGLINIGQLKGAIVTELIAKHRPAVMLELGGYIGYSAILFGGALKQAGGSRFFSVEMNPLFAAVAASLIDLAGLRDTVRVVVGSGAEGIQRLHDEGSLGTQLDVAFFDHHKPSYTKDLKLCERLGLIGKGTVLVADNMILPGNPEYAAYVRASVADKLQKAAGGEETGNPNLEYVSRFVPSYEPSGEQDALEITECTGIAA